MIGRALVLIRSSVLAGSLVVLASCASTEAPSVIRSETNPGGASDATESVDTTDETDTTDLADATDPENSSDPDPTSASTDETSPPSGPPTVDTDPGTSTADTTAPATTLDPKAVDDAIAQWSAVCADAVAGMAVLPTDPTQALGELAKVISDFGEAVATIPKTGTANDPSDAVGIGMTAFATSITDAARAFASGDQAGFERGLGDSYAHVEQILMDIRAFGADC